MSERETGKTAERKRSIEYVEIVDMSSNHVVGLGKVNCVSASERIDATLKGARGGGAGGSGGDGGTASSKR